MSLHFPKCSNRFWIFWAVAAGILLGGAALLVGYGLSPFSPQPPWWRDHPFDFGNILFTSSSWSLADRLWAYDPVHLFGWTPNVFYNPLATWLGSLFVGTDSGGVGAYWIFLLLLLAGSSLCFFRYLPRAFSGWGTFSGALLAGLLSLLVYPADLGILDANVVQVLYTGQWAQRLGVMLGLLCIERFWQAIMSLQDDRSRAFRCALASSALWGACLYCHYMSGYGVAAVLLLLTLYKWVSDRLTQGRFRTSTLFLLPAMIPVLVLLFFDFFFVFWSSNNAYHNLPILGWRLPPLAIETVREVILAGIPILIIPLIRVLASSQRTRLLWMHALFPLLVLLAVVAADARCLFWLFLLLFALSFWVHRAEAGMTLRTLLPVAGFFLLWLSAGPDSLSLFGWDASCLLPFAESIGFAKLAALSRFLFLAWFGFLVADGLSIDGESGPRRRLQQLVAGVLACAGLLVPLTLSFQHKPGAGAETFLSELAGTDQQKTRNLLQRMLEAAKQTPADGYLLVEDTLHHPEGSLIQNQDLPHGHLPYLAATLARRPILGGSVATRTITHPLEHTGRGQLLCQDISAIKRSPTAVLNRLRSLGVAVVLAHSPDMIQAMENYPQARRIDQDQGLVRYQIPSYQPILTDAAGAPIPGSSVQWHMNGMTIDLPGDVAVARIRQVFYPYLHCSIAQGDEKQTCRLAAFSEGPERFRGCEPDDPRSFEVDVPWLQIVLEPKPSGPTRLRIENKPPIFPFLVMTASWIGALVLYLALVLKKKSRPAANGGSNTAQEPQP